MAKQGLEQELLESGGLSAGLLAWYDRHARSLPWRAPPGVRPDPYHVWLSEIMLQQTTVAAVKDYFIKFIGRWPNVKALAAAPLDDVLKAWAGLGYYARARNLHRCAQIVANDLGQRFPESVEELRKLPGVGAYTAGAIAAIAFDRPHAAVDGNVERVISRLYAIEEPLPLSKPAIRERAEALVPQARPGDFAQALMDLGATICTPKSPNCLICPWTEHCQAKALGIAAELPRKLPKKAVPNRYGLAFWVQRPDGAILLRRRPEKGLLGGMMEVPSTEWLSQEPRDSVEQAPLKARWKKLAGKVEHTFTHFHLELAVMRAVEIEEDTLAPDAGYRWVAASEVDSEALPTVMRKIVAHARR